MSVINQRIKFTILKNHHRRFWKLNSSIYIHRGSSLEYSIAATCTEHLYNFLRSIYALKATAKCVQTLERIQYSAATIYLLRATMLSALIF